MSENTVNIPLLRKAVEWAEAEAVKPPELREWEQNWWVLTPEKRAERLRAENPDLFSETERQAYTKAPECGTCYCIAGFVAAQMGSTATGYETEAVATEALGIDPAGADSLFHFGNTIQDVRRIAEEIAGERL